jgi:hypothetical protein
MQAMYAPYPPLRARYLRVGRKRGSANLQFITVPWQGTKILPAVVLSILPVKLIRLSTRQHMRIVRLLIDTKDGQITAWLHILALHGSVRTDAAIRRHSDDAFSFIHEIE